MRVVKRTWSLVRAIVGAGVSSIGRGIDGCLVDLLISTFLELPVLKAVIVQAAFAVTHGARCSACSTLASPPKDTRFWSRRSFARNAKACGLLRFQSPLQTAVPDNRRCLEKLFSSPPLSRGGSGLGPDRLIANLTAFRASADKIEPVVIGFVYCVVNLAR